MKQVNLYFCRALSFCS